MKSGRIRVTARDRLRDRHDLARVYTPGVADDVRKISDDPGSAESLTGRTNSVLVVTDGSAVLGVGDVGPLAALPVMEGKAALLSTFADVDAWPLCLRSRDPDEIVRTIADVATGVGALNLEDIAAPRCFDVVERLREAVDIPVFHDDQHGTAVVVLAALRNAVRRVDKSLNDLSVVVAGAGAAGSAVARILMHVGVHQTIVCDSAGTLHLGRELEGEKRWLAENTNPDGIDATLASALQRADVLIGVSTPDILDGEDLAQMNDDAIVFALANPDPEIDADVAKQHAAVVATGRSDDPHQINNALVFPGLFRGLLDGAVAKVDEALLVRVADAIAGLVDNAEDRIIPDMFDRRLVPTIADAVQNAR